MNILPAATPQDILDAGTLFREYSELVAEALCFQDFDQELAALPGEYASPGGVLLIARDADAAAGCVALRRLDAGTGEMKRMYARVVLDTLPKLAAAIALYRNLGFREIGPYLESPTPCAICFELRIS